VREREREREEVHRERGEIESEGARERDWWRGREREPVTSQEYSD
jgi:hypothetical protein